MGRNGWLLLFFGVVAGVHGIQEYTVGRECSEAPVLASLAELEKGAACPNCHLRLGTHIAVYPGSIFSYKGRRGEDPSPTAEVTYAYYPIISDENPFITKLRELSKHHGGTGKVPKTEFPKVCNAAVLVKTKRFICVAVVPDRWKREAGVRGLVVNRIETLGSQERNLLQGSFPGLDLDKVLILEEGRAPSSFVYCSGMVALGVALLIGGVAALLAQRRG